MIIPIPGKWGYSEPHLPELPRGTLIILRSKRALLGAFAGDFGFITNSRQWADGHRFYKVYINGKITEVSDWEVERA